MATLNFHKLIMGKMKIGIYCLFHCRYFDESVLEMFVEWSPTKQCRIKNTFASRLIGTGNLWRLSILIKKKMKVGLNFLISSEKLSYVTSVLDITKI